MCLIRLFSKPSGGIEVSGRLIPLALLFLVGGFSAGWATVAKADPEVPPPFLAVDKACTPEEHWRFSKKVPQGWRKLLKAPPASPGFAVTSYALGATLKRSAKVQELGTFGDYVMGRALYQAGMVHLAQRRFDQLIGESTAPLAHDLRIAALECLEKIRDKVPSLGISGVGVIGLKAMRKGKLNVRESELVDRALIWHFKREPTIEGLGNFIPGSSYHSYARMLLAAAQDDDAVVIAAGTKFLEPVSGKEPAKADRDSAEILVARAYYHLGKLDAAIEAFKKVSRNSIYFAQSYSDLAWAYLRLRKYNEAVSTAYNLIVGGLARSFMPEAMLITAIAYFETCHYPEASRTIRHFKKKFGPIYQWLIHWNKSVPSAGPDGKPYLYSLTINELKQSGRPKQAGKPAVPEKLVFEWVNSSILLTHQLELNLVIDEQAALKKLLLQVQAQHKRAGSGYKPAYLALRDLLNSFSREIPSIQAARVQAVEKALTDLNRAMLAQLTETGENIQFVDVEVLNAAGDDIIRENSRAPVKKVAEGQSGTDQGATLDWGKFSPEEDSEIWEDELGYLRSEVSTICIKK